MMRTYLTLPALLLALAVLPGCGEDEPPSEERAEQSLEQFGEAVDSMREDKEQLQSEVDQLQQRFREQLDKHFTLVEERLAGYEQRLTKLPAEREVEARKVYEQLVAKATELRGLYAKWSQASGEQAAALRTQLDTGREQLEAAFTEFESQVADAEEAATAN